MKKPFLAEMLIGFAVLGGLVPYVAAESPQQNATSQSQSLYARLGGYDALAAVTKDFIGRLATDPQLSRFFVGLNDASKARVEAHVIDFLCVATGGPCLYTGQDMKTAHTGLHITESDWNASSAHLTETLNKFHVPQKEQTEVMSAITGLKGDIVGR
ncbi:MAG TPA: group 1 truncated hemoglobin [Terriglobales bacterium]|nr:group 1 truncated hemoglobin [Terriglobales bacterium]